MDSIGLWHIGDVGPVRLPSTQVQVESDLEEWIERDPSLLERGLAIVGRQLWLDGGPLDLLALDPQGRWVLIEIKRGRLRRDAVAQAIDYASSLHAASTGWLRDKCAAYLKSRGGTHTIDGLLEQRGRTLEDEDGGREIVIYLVGTGIDAGLARMVSYLAERAEMSVRLVTFNAFSQVDGRVLLAREIHERDAEPARDSGKAATASPTVDAVLAMGDRNGVGPVMRALHAGATDVGLHVRVWGKSIMFAPPAAKSRCLFTVWAERRAQQPPGTARVYISHEVFEQFYGVKDSDVAAAVGPAGFVMMDHAAAARAAAGLRDLLAPRDSD